MFKSFILQSRYVAFFLCALFATAIASCSMSCSTTPGYNNVDTTRKALLVATAEIRGANLLLRDLAQRNVIDNESAREAHAALQTALDTVKEGLTAIDVAGDPLTAETKLQAANASITIALTLLSNFTGDP